MRASLLLAKIPTETEFATKMIIVPSLQIPIRKIRMVMGSAMPATIAQPSRTPIKKIRTTMGLGMLAHPALRQFAEMGLKKEARNAMI
jgi:hypothetical protein